MVVGGGAPKRLKLILLRAPKRLGPALAVCESVANPTLLLLQYSMISKVTLISY